MVFGALLGGAVTRAGERFQESAERQRRTEDWQRQNNLQLQLDFFTKNYGNMTPEQHEASLRGFAPLIGMKEKEWRSLIGGMKAISSVIPPQYMDAQGLGASRSATGSVAVTPSKEPAVRGIEAPASIEIGQIPQPSDIGTPSIYASTAEHRATLPIPVGQPMPTLRPGERVTSQTPNEVLAQRKLESDRALRQQNIADFQGDPRIPAEYKPIMTASEYGFKGASSYETGMAGVDQRRAAANQRYATAVQKMNALYKEPNVFKRGEQNIFVWDTPSGPVEIGADGEPVRFIPQSTDTIADPVSQGKGTDFAKNVARWEAQLGRPLTATEVEHARARFPDAPYSIKTKINGQDVSLETSRSRVIGANAPRANAPPAPRSSGVTPATPAAPLGKGTTVKAVPAKNFAPSASPKIGAVPNVPNVGGLVFPSQISEGKQESSDQLAVMADQTRRMHELLQKPAVKAKIGFGTGWWTGLKRQAMDVDKDPATNADINDMFGIASDFQDMILRARSGKAITNTEFARLQKFVPNVNTPPHRFESDLSRFVGEINVILANRGKPLIQLSNTAPGAGNPNIIDSSKGTESPEARKQRLRERYGVR